MRKISRNILKELSIHLLIVASFAGMGWLYMQSQIGESKVVVPQRRYVAKEISLHLASLQRPNQMNSKSKVGSDILQSYQSRNGLIFTLRCVNGGASFCVGTNSSLCRSIQRIPDTEVYQGDWSKIRLACDGSFFESDHIITYTCYHLPQVYVFNDKGEALGIIYTIDEVPYPIFHKHSGRVTLERGYAHNSNIASFVRNGIVYVMSEQVLPVDPYIIFDCYRISDKVYLYSMKARSNTSLSNLYVSAISLLNDSLVIFTHNAVYRESE